MIRFQMNTLKNKLNLMALALIFLMIFVGISAVIQIRGLSSTFTETMEINYLSVHAAYSMQSAITESVSLLSRAPVETAAWERLSLRFTDALKLESGNLTEPGEKEAYEAVCEDYASFEQLVRLQMAAGGKEQELITVADRIRNQLNILEDLNTRAIYRKESGVSDKTNQSVMVVAALSLAAVGLGVASTIYARGRIVRPLEELKGYIRRVREGNFRYRIQMNTRDEIGEIASEFNAMLIKLQEYENSAVGRLLNERNRTLSIVKSIAEPLIVLDTDLRIVLVNDASESLFSLHEEAVRSAHVREAVISREVIDLIEMAADGKKNEEILEIPHEGRAAYYHIVIRPIRELNGRNTGYTILFQDITAMKELDKVKNDFIATVSHEFKTPLTAIMMASDLLADPAFGPLDEERLNVVDTIREDVERMTNLVSELLELIRIESGGTVFDMQDAAVSRIVPDSVRQFRSTVERKHIQITTDIPEHLPEVRADAEKIRWVLNNLISNALKYSAEGDTIRVETRIQYGVMLFSVTDQGPGVPPDYQQRIFEKFVQVQGYDLEVRGTGLGLAVSREIVEAHGGEIWYDREFTGGSRFMFTLPLAVPATDNKQ